MVRASGNPGRALAGLGLLVFLATASLGPGALVGALEWPLGIGPYTPEGQACISANVVATQLNTFEQASTPAEARGQLRQAGRSISSLARVVRLEPQHRQLVALGSSISTALDALQQGRRDDALAALERMATKARAVNRWYADTCNSWTIRLPIWLNDVYAGGFPTFA